MRMNKGRNYKINNIVTLRHCFFFTQTTPKKKEHYYWCRARTSHVMQVEIPTFLKSQTASVTNLFGALLNPNPLSRRASFSLKPLATERKSCANPQDQQLQQGIILQIEKTDPELQTEAIVKILSFIEKNLLQEAEPDIKTCFHGSKVPQISVLDYLQRIVKYVNKWAEDSPSASSSGIHCLIMGLYFIQSLPIKLTPLSFHRLILTAVLLAIKTSEDFAISNKFWGDVGGCTLHEVNEMEVRFCQYLSWKLFISSDEFNKLSRELLIIV